MDGMTIIYGVVVIGLLIMLGVVGRVAFKEWQSAEILWAHLLKVIQVLPETYYAGKDVGFRVGKMVEDWKHAIESNQCLEDRNGELDAALQAAELEVTKGVGGQEKLLAMVQDLQHEVKRLGPKTAPYFPKASNTKAPSLAEMIQNTDYPTLATMFTPSEIKTLWKLQEGGASLDELINGDTPELEQVDEDNPPVGFIAI